MKKTLIISMVLLFLASCNDSKVEENAWFAFEIPTTVNTVDVPEIITVDGNEVQLAGSRLAVGDTLTDVVMDNKASAFNEVSTWSIKDFEGYKLIETVPSLDTPVCTMQTKQLEFAAWEFPNVNFLVISNDTPFALERFCSANGIENIKVFSDARTREFGRQNWLYLEQYGLLTRSIMIVNWNNEIEYIEYASEVTSELDLMNALAFLNSKVK